jgi:hypothetical protein
MVSFQHNYFLVCVTNQIDLMTELIPVWYHRFDFPFEYDVDLKRSRILELSELELGG